MGSQSTGFPHPITVSFSHRSIASGQVNSPLRVENCHQPSAEVRHRDRTAIKQSSALSH